LTHPLRFPMQDRVKTVPRLLTGYPGSEAMAIDDQKQLTDYSPDGVDLTLIRWMLSLTPAERIEYLEQHVNDILSIRAVNGRT
jgi:hypothetical protein